MWYNGGNNGDVQGISLSSTKNESAKDKNLAKWLRKFTDSWEYAQQNYHIRWDKNWKLYHNIRVKRSHNGVVKTFVPMVNSTVNTMVASLFNSIPSVRYMPNHPDQEANTEVLNEIYADFARRDGWVQKNKINGKQGLITGNFVSFYEWKMDKNGGYVHKVVVPIRDAIIDPQSHSYEDWRYVGRRYFASKRQLEKETIYDFEKGKDVKRFKKIEEIIPGGTLTDYESDKQRKDQAIGTTAPGDKDMIEIIEIWTRKEVVVIAGRNTIIEQRPNPHYQLDKALYEQRKAEHELAQLQNQAEIESWQATRTMTLANDGVDIGEWQGEVIGDFDEEFNEEEAGLLPFAHGRDYEDISLPYGDSDVDIIADQQELLNDITELNIEAILYQLYPEKTLDPKFSTWANNLDPKPGKVYTIPAGGLVWNNPPTIPTNAFNERLNIKDEMREAVAISEVTKGVASTDDVTATEIKAQVGQADVRITEKAQTLANDYFFQEAKIVLKMVQLYAPDEMWVRTIDDAKADFKQVNPRIFLGEYTPMVTLEVEKKMQEKTDQQAYIDAFQIIIQDPTNNLQAAKQILYKKIMPSLSQEEIDEIITPTQQAPMLQATTQPVDMPIPTIQQDLAQQGGTNEQQAMV